MKNNYCYCLFDMNYNGLEFCEGQFYKYESMGNISIIYDEYDDDGLVSDCFEIMYLNDEFLCYSDGGEFRDLFVIVDKYIDNCEKIISKILR